MKNSPIKISNVTSNLRRNRNQPFKNSQNQPKLLSLSRRIYILAILYISPTTTSSDADEDESLAYAASAARLISMKPANSIWRINIKSECLSLSLACVKLAATRVV